MSGTLTLTLTKNPKGKHQLKVDLESPPDAMSHEHEEEHAKIVSSLLGKNKNLTSGRDYGQSSIPTSESSLEREAISSES